MGLFLSDPKKHSAVERLDLISILLKESEVLLSDHLQIDLELFEKYDCVNSEFSN